jgi:hypothetical protein
MKQPEDALDEFIRNISEESVRVKPLEATIEQQENYTKPLKRDIEKPEWDPWKDNSIEDLFT